MLVLLSVPSIPPGSAKETYLRRAGGRRVLLFEARVAGLANNECGPGPEGNLPADNPGKAATDPEFPGDASAVLERSICIVVRSTSFDSAKTTLS